MGAIAQIKKCSRLDLVLGYVNSTDPVIVSDVSVAGSPGPLDPEGFGSNGVAKWIDRACGIVIGMPYFTLFSRAPTKTSRITRVNSKYVHPVLEVTSPSTSTGIQPSPTKAYELTWNNEFLIPERATLAERTAFYSACLSLMVRRTQASDGIPTDTTGTPLIDAVLLLDKPY